MGINIDSIMSKVNAWAKSSEGKARINDYIDNKRRRGGVGGGGTGSGASYILTLADMESIAEDMIQMLKSEASSSSVPPSVLDHFNSLTHTSPVAIGANIYTIDIYFEDDLSRMSLLITSGKRKGQRTGEGVKNIVSLFDTGYQASNRVYGLWEGHEGAGEIGSRTSLGAKYFIERAVDAFNRKYGGAYSAKITASSEFYSSFNY